jgi:acyl-CoA dehydrogenase
MQLVSMRAPWADAELDALRELVRNFLASEAAPRHSEWERQHHVDREFWLQAGSWASSARAFPSSTGAPAEGLCMRP